MATPATQPPRKQPRVGLEPLRLAKRRYARLAPHAASSAVRDLTACRAFNKDQKKLVMGAGHGLCAFARAIEPIFHRSRSRCTRKGAVLGVANRPRPASAATKDARTGRPVRFQPWPTWHKDHREVALRELQHGAARARRGGVLRARAGDTERIEPNTPYVHSVLHEVQFRMHNEAVYLRTASSSRRSAGGWRWI